jgi:hypothetical protein
MKHVRQHLTNSQGMLLLLGTWSHLWHVWGSMFALICISCRSYKIDLVRYLSHFSFSKIFKYETDVEHSVVPFFLFSGIYRIDLRNESMFLLVNGGITHTPPPLPKWRETINKLNKWIASVSFNYIKSKHKY